MTHVSEIMSIEMQLEQAIMRDDVREEMNVNASGERFDFILLGMSTGLDRTEPDRE